MTIALTENLTETHGMLSEFEKSVMFPVPEMMRVQDVELNDQVKLSPHEPESSRGLDAYATASSRASG